MIVLIPMGGEGSRFRDAGYTTNKPCLPVIDRHSGVAVPMVLAAMRDIPGIRDSGTEIICVDRAFHAADGTEEAIRQEFPQTRFVHDHLLLDQAFACLLAREFLRCDRPLLVAACDNGLDIDMAAFEAQKARSDAIMISHCGDDNIARDPAAHSWARMSPDGDRLAGVSIKQPVSADYMQDHATTGMFWFRSAAVFLQHLEHLLLSGQAFGRKVLVDEVLHSFVVAGLTVRHVDVRYHCWGTPADYETYHATYAYWSDFHAADPWLRA